MLLITTEDKVIYFFCSWGNPRKHADMHKMRLTETCDLLACDRWGLSFRDCVFGTLWGPFQSFGDSSGPFRQRALELHTRTSHQDPRFGVWFVHVCPVRKLSHYITWALSLRFNHDILEAPITFKKKSHRTPFLNFSHILMYDSSRCNKQCRRRYAKLFDCIKKVQEWDLLLFCGGRSTEGLETSHTWPPRLDSPFGV